MSTHVYNGVKIQRRTVSNLKTPVWKFVLPRKPDPSYLYSYTKTLREAKARIDASRS